MRRKEKRKEYLLHAGLVGTIISKTAAEKIFLGSGEETALLGPVNDEERGEDGNSGGDSALDDVDPTPSSEAVRAAEVSNSVSEQLDGCFLSVFWPYLEMEDEGV